MAASAIVRFGFSSRLPLRLRLVVLSQSRVQIRFRDLHQLSHRLFELLEWMRFGVPGLHLAHAVITLH